MVAGSLSFAKQLGGRSNGGKGMLRTGAEKDGRAREASVPSTGETHSTKLVRGVVYFYLAGDGPREGNLALRLD